MGFLPAFNEEIGRCVQAKPNQSDYKGQVEHYVEICHKYLRSMSVQGHSRAY